MILPRFVQSRLLGELPGIYHAFLGVDPARGRGQADRLRLFAVPPGRIGTLRQVHRADVLELAGEDLSPRGAGRREGDALWTAAPGTGVGVHTADCVPLLLAHREIPLVAAVHAGWRGIAADVAGETVRAIAAGLGGDRILDGLVAAAGPSALGCCYEIGEEVAALLAPLPGGERHLRKGSLPGKWRADLRALAVAGLCEAGIGRDRIETAGPCTVCSTGYHSYRREKSLTGRQLSFIYNI